MNPVTHMLSGWLVANAAGLDRRDRMIVTAASVAPDVDGLGLIVDFATHSGGSPTQWFAEYHHVLPTIFFRACGWRVPAPRQTKRLDGLPRAARLPPSPAGDLSARTGPGGYSGRFSTCGRSRMRRHGRGKDNGS
jgi:hypothetical protein